MTPPNIFFDDELRDKPRDVAYTKVYVQYLKDKLAAVVRPQDKVKILGEIGVYLRILDDLGGAEVALTEALRLIDVEKLPVALEVQQKIRLAHVLQWQRCFERSSALFAEIISICECNTQARCYIDLAWQHAGKNFFDQQNCQLALGAFETALSMRMLRNAPEDQIESTELAIRRTVYLMRQSKV